MNTRTKPDQPQSCRGSLSHLAFYVSRRRLVRSTTSASCDLVPTWCVGGGGANLSAMPSSWSSNRWVTITTPAGMGRGPVLWFARWWFRAVGTPTTHGLVGGPAVELPHLSRGLVLVKWPTRAPPTSPLLRRCRR